MGVNDDGEFQYAHIRASNVGAQLSSDNIYIAGSNAFIRNYSTGDKEQQLRTNDNPLLFRSIIHLYVTSVATGAITPTSISYT